MKCQFISQIVSRKNFCDCYKIKSKIITYFLGILVLSYSKPFISERTSSLPVKVQASHRMQNQFYNDLFRLNTTGKIEFLMKLWSSISAKQVILT